MAPAQAGPISLAHLRKRSPFHSAKSRWASGMWSGFVESGPLRPVQPLVHGDALSVADDPHRALGGADLHLAAHIGERDGVPSSVEGDMVVKIDGGGLARDHLVGFARQRDEQRFLLAEDVYRPCCPQPLEGPRVDPGDVVQERRVERIEGCEDAVAERGDRLLLYDPDPHLHGRLVPGAPRTARHDGASVVLGHAPVLLVDHELVDGVLRHSLLEVVRNEDRRGAAEEGSADTWASTQDSSLMS